MDLGLSFFGAAQTVTGSKFLLDLEGRYVLIDCGLFQGVRDQRIQNWENLPIDPSAIQAVILTHAHLDHTGYLPLLIKKGFKGTIFCTDPTKAITELILVDAAHIQEEEAMKALREGYSRHTNPQPLFDTNDAKRVFPHLNSIPLSTWRELFAHCRFRLIHSGHILGSAIVEIDYQGTRIVFTGDLGRKKPILLDPPVTCSSADYLIIESTYGDRKHSTEPVQQTLTRIIKETLARGGDLIIPSFAIGRTQDLLFLFSELKRRKQIPDLPIYLDSPMGIEATEIFYRFSEWHKLNSSQVKQMEKAAMMMADSKGSKMIRNIRRPKIIIAGSGMVTGGRILEHLKKSLPEEKNTVLLVGYQAAGTRGRQIRDRSPEIKIQGNYFKNRAHVEEVTTLSAHADQPEMLTWLRGFSKKPLKTFIVHGEPQASDALRVKIEHSLGWECHIPKPFETVSLSLKNKRSRSS